MEMEAEPQVLRAQLANFAMFTGLDGDTLDMLATAGRRRDFEPGEVVFLEGDVAEGLYILASGWVRAVKASAQGREQVLQFVGPGETFNNVAVFTSMPNPATAIALERSSAWMIPRATIQRLIRERPAFAGRVITNMAERLVYLVGLVADLSLRSVSGRLASLILDEAEGGVLARPRWLTIAEVAARLGTVPDVVQRALGRFQSDGLIDVSRREIRILDERGLRLIAHD